MENKRSGHISEGELDHLLNEAFLNLDFESNSQNKEVLSIVARHAMQKQGISRLFNMRRLDLLFLLLSIFVFSSSFYRYSKSLSLEEKDKAGVAMKTTKEGRGAVTQAVKAGLIQNPDKERFSLITNARAIRTKSARSVKEKSGTIPEAIKISVPDSVSIITNTDPGVSEGPVSSVDNTLNVTENQLKVSKPSVNRESGRSDKVQQLKQNGKVKAGKRRKMNFLSFMRKKKRSNKRFLKTSGR